MDKILTEIINVLLTEIERMPTFYKIISLLVMLFFFMYFANQNFRTAVKKISLKKIKFNSKFIESNELFLSERYFFSQINNIDLKDNDKERLFKIILREKVKTTIELTKTFYKNVKDKYKNWSIEIFYQEIYTLIFSIIETYEQKIKQKFIELHGKDKGLLLFDFVYTNGFKPYHKENVEQIEMQIRKVLQSRIKSPEIKLYYVFIQFYIALENAIADNETVFYKFNGNLNRILK